MKNFFAFVMLLAIPLCSIAQTAKKPTLMILPSDNWCVQRYFTQTIPNQGMQVRVPDYLTAFQEDAELGGVISKVGQLLTEKGYSLKDCEQELKSIQLHVAEDNVTYSKDGASIVESPLDILKRRVKSDVVIQIGWQVNKESSGKSITFTIEAFDCYTNKRIATSSGVGIPSNDIIPVQIESAIREHIDAFDSQMVAWYNDILSNGREISMTIKCWDSWENDLETEYNNVELIDSIQKWLNKHSVNSTFNLTDQTEKMAQFEQIRIPLYNSDGMPMDARSFANELRVYLKQEYQISAKILTRGLGEANIILGGK